MKTKDLNIFNSSFGIRANLKNKEIEIQNFWKKINLLQEITKKKQKFFCLHIGPPYANGNVHIGHALNFILKDFALRFHSLNNYQILAIPGWDTHGLPIALSVTKQNNLKTPVNKNTSIDFRQKCAQFAQKQVQKQTQQLERLGTQINFQEKYLTLTSDYVAQQLRIFAKMVAKKLIFRSIKPVYWSWSSQTALADTEVKYLAKKSTSIFILFSVEKNKNIPINSAFLVWTTTPWTIPANQFLAINIEIEYVLIQISQIKKNIIVAKKLFHRLQKELSPLTEAKIIKSWKGKTLIGSKYFHPYLNLASTVLHSEHVNLNEGTGVVHVAPAHGLEDFYLVKQMVDVVCTVDHKGFFNEKTLDRDLKGKFYIEAEKIIMKKLQQTNSLLGEKEIIHQYPHDWRTKKPVIYRTTDQWYLNLLPLKTKIKKLIQQMEWIPSWGKKRMTKILKARNDWCLSRQRKWGVPIPVFINKNQKPVLNVEIVQHIADLIEKNNDNLWWKQEISQLLTPQQITKYQIVDKTDDTFDVWFDSGCSAQIVHPENSISLIWEGNDQYRGWFNSLIIVAALENKQQIKKVLTHGFVNDVSGRKMSKSEGNVVDPLEICQTYGADVLRLWVGSSNYFEDLSLDKNVIESTAKNYVKIRNTIRFLINNLVDFDIKTNYCEILTEIDYLILIKTNILIEKVTKYFQKFQFHLAYQLLNNFAINDLSSSYFDYAKKILYPSSKNTLERRQIQTTFFFILEKLIVLWAPFIPHTIEEAYQTINWKNKQKSVHLLHWPKKINLNLNPKTENKILLKWKFIKEMKKNIHKILEVAVKAKKITLFKEAIVFINYDKKYKLFKNKLDYQSFCQQFALKNKDNYQNINDLFNNFIQEIEKIQNIHFFWKTQKVIFKNIKKGTKTDCGYIWFEKINNPLCQRCNLNESLKKQVNCNSCQTTSKLQ